MRSVGRTLAQEPGMVVHGQPGSGECDHEQVSLFFLEAWFEFELIASYLPGV